MTLRLRLAAWYALVGAATLVVVVVVVWLQYSGALRRSTDEALQATALAAVDILDTDPAGRPDPDTLPRGVFLVLFDASGGRTYASPGAPALGRPPLGTSTLRGPEDPASALYAATTRDGRIVVAGTALADVDRSLASLAGTMVIVVGAGVILSVLGGWWLAGRALQPVARLTREADAIGASELDRRLLELEGDDELGALVRTLNRMLGRVEESVRRQRAFVTAASHDLRTPLAALRTELELALLHPTEGPALRAAVEAAHADAVRLSELAGGLLRLAAAEPDGRRLDREEIPVERLVRSGHDLVAAYAVARGVTIDLRLPDAIVRVDRPRFVQVIANLLANALRFAPPASTVEVVAEVDAGDEPPVLRVEVLDRGPGVPPDFRSSLFEPFTRARQAASPGAGLGLATAAAAVHAHGGAIGYDERPGGGARFWFWVPA